VIQKAQQYPVKFIFNYITKQEEVVNLSQEQKNLGVLFKDWGKSGH
jgi:hypothetical protein